jgi:hypothetical protein
VFDHFYVLDRLAKYLAQAGGEDGGGGTAAANHWVTGRVSCYLPMQSGCSVDKSMILSIFSDGF